MESSEQQIPKSNPEMLKNQALANLMDKVEKCGTSILLIAHHNGKRRAEVAFNGNHFSAAAKDWEDFELPYGNIRIPCEESLSGETVAGTVAEEIISFIKEVREEIKVIGVIDPKDIEEEIVLWVGQLYDVVSTLMKTNVETEEMALL